MSSLNWLMMGKKGVCGMVEAVSTGLISNTTIPLLKNGLYQESTEHSFCHPSGPTNYQMPTHKLWEQTPWIR